MTIRLAVVVGARPQFIKHFPLDRALRQHPAFAPLLIHTGQHFDERMSKVFFDELGMSAPDVNLGIAGGTHGAMTGRMLEAVEAVLIEREPDMVMVYGDTNSTLAGALAASKLYLPVVHIEAGLRSFNRRMPEEINRVLTDHVSRWLMCPTEAAVAHLAAEGITGGVHHVGDVMMDATLLARPIARERSDLPERLGLAGRDYAVATVHRAENTDDPAMLRRLLDWLLAQARERMVILPLHPRTRKLAAAHGLALDGLTCIEPVGYLDMNRLLDGCSAVFTNSGGLQKEAYFHGKPCVTLRSETEWPETVAAGWNRLWQEPAAARPRRPIDDFGDGRAAERVLELLAAAPA